MWLVGYTGPGKVWLGCYTGLGKLWLGGYTGPGKMWLTGAKAARGIPGKITGNARDGWWNRTI